MTTKEILEYLKSEKITGEDKTLIISALLENIDALPIREVVSFDEHGTLQINGRQLAPEQMVAFRESAQVLKDNFSRKILNEQVTHLAVKKAIHEGLNPEMIMFGKAALWTQQEMEKLLAVITL